MNIAAPVILPRPLALASNGWLAKGSSYDVGTVHFLLVFSCALLSCSKLSLERHSSYVRVERISHRRSHLRNPRELCIFVFISRGALGSAEPLRPTPQI